MFCLSIYYDIPITRMLPGNHPSRQPSASLRSTWVTECCECYCCQTVMSPLNRHQRVLHPWFFEFLYSFFQVKSYILSGISQALNSVVERKRSGLDIKTTTSCTTYIAPILSTALLTPFPWEVQIHTDFSERKYFPKTQSSKIFKMANNF